MVHRAPESSSIPYILLAVTGVLCFAVLAVWTVSGESLSANVLHTLCGLSLVTCGTVAYTLKGRWVTVSIGYGSNGKETNGIYLIISVKGRYINGSERSFQ